MSEFITTKFQAVVYSINSLQQKWTAKADEKWATVCTLVEPLGNVGNYRIVAWIEDSGELVLNESITQTCKWLSISPDFRHFITAKGDSFGLYFIDALTTEKITKYICKIIALLHDERDATMQKESQYDTSDEICSINRDSLYIENMSISSSDTYEDEIGIENQVESPCHSSHCTANTDDVKKNFHSIEEKFTEKEKDFHQLNKCSSLHSKLEDAITCNNDIESKRSDFKWISSTSIIQESNYKRGFLQDALGSNKLINDSIKNSVDVTSEDDIVIGLPYHIKQEIHITYDTEHARFEGLPDKWKHLNQQFGIPLAAVPKRRVDGYKDRIPAILVMLKEQLFLSKGDQIEGIFRIAPAKEKCDQVKQDLNNGSYNTCKDMHIFANLIKIWFRELPQSLFDEIDDAIVSSICPMKNDKQVIDRVNQLHEPASSLILWLLDMMCEIVVHESINKMSVKNMAIVMSPNLFTVNVANPMVAITKSQKMVEFTTRLLNARLRTYHSNKKT